MDEASQLGLHTLPTTYFLDNNIFLTVLQLLFHIHDKTSIRQRKAQCRKGGACLATLYIVADDIASPELCFLHATGKNFNMTEVMGRSV